jgi:hypothetical protein
MPELRHPDLCITSLEMAEGHRLCVDNYSSDLRMYPLEGGIGAQLVWCFSNLVLFIIFCAGSFRLCPPEIELIPADGPIRLNL